VHPEVPLVDLGDAPITFADQMLYSAAMGGIGEQDEAVIVVGLPVEGSGHRGEVYGVAVSRYQESKVITYTMDWRLSGAHEGATFGEPLSIWDLDGDGLGSVAIGADYSAVDSEPNGYLFVFDEPGGHFSTSTEADLALWGDAEDSHLAASTGDFDGDGAPDVAVGVGHGYALPTLGTVYLAFGPLDSSRSFSEVGDAAVGTEDQDHFGGVLELGADLDGDGLDDLAIGSPFSGLSEGRVHLARGGEVLSPTSEDLLSARGAAAGALAGYALSVDADFDGDGLQDLVVGSPGLSTSPDESGAVYVVPEPFATFAGEREFWSWIAGFGDYSVFGEEVVAYDPGDGTGPVLLVGASDSDVLERNAGAVYRFEGLVPGTLTVADATLAYVAPDLDGDDWNDRSRVGGVLEVLPASAQEGPLLLLGGRATDLWFVVPDTYR